jgi:molybdate/tungstate transport system ATP-binding protein
MLEVKQLSKNCGDFRLGPIDLQINAGEHIVLLGPSGSGKSLLLEILCGFTRPDTGGVILNGTEILRLRPDKRKTGLVMQHPALFPHLTVEQNIAYPLKNKGLSGADIKKEVGNFAEKCKVSHLIRRNPGSLSGGEIQRVSIARTLAARPDLLLLDEPLSSLDVQLRDDLRKLIRSLKDEHTPVLHVTHDPEEALRLADRVGIMQAGMIVQIGDPVSVMRNPSNAFVARMSGLKNYFKAVVEPAYQSETHIAKVNHLYFKFEGNIDHHVGFVLIDENQISISVEKPRSSALNVFEGIITECNKMNSGTEVTIDIGVNMVARITDESFHSMNLGPGLRCWISFKAPAVRFIG